MAVELVQRMRRALPLLVAALALFSIYVAVSRLEQSAESLVISRERVGTAPVTIFRPAPNMRPGEAPVVVIAHGFAGSQQLMQPFALTLARNGFVAITFDFPGHGRNSAPMWGGLVDQPQSHRVLLAAMEEIGSFARGLAGADGRYAVVGHSMASDIVLRHAQRHNHVEATVGISMFAPSIDADTPGDNPRNLLVIDGALEPSMMAAEALRIVGRVAGPDAAAGVTYGNFAAGTARRASLAPGAEHISVLYNATTQAETLAWLNAAFGRPTAPDAFVEARGRWIGLLLAGVVGLAWPLSLLLPRLADPETGTPARLRWRRAWPLAVAPALLTPLILWKMPSDFLSILLGDYLMLHFAVYGLLTMAIMALMRRPVPRILPGRSAALWAATLIATAYAVIAVGVPFDRYIFNVHPEWYRAPLILAMCAGTLPYFLADEWLARDPGAPRAAGFASEAAFLVSLVLAIALNPHKLFFLAIIVPAILALFLIYGLFSRWAYRRTRHPAVGAVAKALAFGYFIAVTFPLVS